MIPSAYEEIEEEDPEPREAWPVIDMDELCSNLAARVNKMYVPGQHQPPPAPQKPKTITSTLPQIRSV